MQSLGTVANDVESDELLMTRYAGGDASALDALFARYVTMLHRFFARSFRECERCEDLLQATFLRLHASRAAYRPGAAVRPWLFAIAAHVRIDELRRAYRRDGRESPIEDSELVDCTGSVP